MKIPANGITMEYQIEGKGECLVLIHGSGDNLNVWYQQVPDFSRYFKVLVYDVRGHGQTEVVNGEYNFTVWVDDLYALLMALEISQVYLLGHSMGGSIAASFTIRYPEMVKALILSNSGKYDDPVSEPEGSRLRRLRQEQMDALKTGGMLEAFKIRVATMFLPDFINQNPDVVEKYMKIWLQNGPEGYSKVMQYRDHRGTIDFTQISCPTLIVVGEGDAWINPERGRALHRTIAGSQIKVFPTGHATPMAAPYDFNETVLSFLKDLKG